MHRPTQLRSAIDPTTLVKGEGVTSRPTTSWPDSRIVRTSASPRWPLLPVTKIFMIPQYSRHEVDQPCQQMLSSDTRPKRTYSYVNRPFPWRTNHPSLVPPFSQRRSA